MPIYEYKCKKCDNQFSKLVFNMDTKIECPICKSENCEKLISRVSASSGSSVKNDFSGGCASGFS
ncbi:regulatory protein, FmdB family [Denitrovibrio acetiphilus DSM 12809]|uniref:Regulatory protein, FmdB family n=1 Tax=Denitrovibrio acetiphilus (strain DSM 12809 / NBRC 114555 / N2460) TaxID=522772 RepID=D4H7P5_DENA2|nr:zinc ribbon domain-containing protein [Denitrovibrio acetiphilus]ADD68044.1 regulatory protein, FmdB family [Denitrovibrio acetiphilus DSM 12809]